MQQQPKVLNKDKVIADMAMRKEAYERVFNSDDGKLILNDLRASAYFYKTSFNSDTHIMAYNEGARTLVLHIEQMSKPKDKPKGKAIKEGDTHE